MALHFGANAALEFGRLYTLSFVIYFILGIFLAVRRDQICTYLESVSPSSRVILWAAVYLLFNVRWLTPWPSLYADIANGIGSALLIALVLTSAGAQRFLTLKPFLWLGAVSYSLYLIHVPVLMAMVHLMDTWLPLAVILSFVPLVSLLIASIFHRLVEVPTTELGRRLAKRISQPPANRDARRPSVTTGQSM
jgi:peptidoglycan/LPS O-acetylase OafA/YrhL